MNIPFHMFWVFLVDTFGSIAMLILAFGIYKQAYSLRHRSFIHLYLFLVAISLAAFSVSRAAGHLLKRILVTIGYTHIWKTFIPFSGGINSIIFVVIATSSFLYILFRQMQEERDHQHAVHVAEIEKARDFLQNVIDSLNAQLFVVDKDLNIQMINKKLEEDLAIGKKSHINAKCHQLIHCGYTGIPGSGDSKEPEHIVCPWRKVHETKEPVLLIHKHKTSSGEERVMEIMASPVLNPDGEVEYMIETLRDITEKVRLEEKLREKEKTEGVIEMAAAVAHELNTPLFVTLGNAQLLQSEFEEDDPYYEELQTIIEQIKKVTELTKKMATITHYEAKDYVGDVKYIDIEKSVKNE